MLPWIILNCNDQCSDLPHANRSQLPWYATKCIMASSHGWSAVNFSILHCRYDPGRSLSLSPQSTHAVLPGVYCGLMSVLISWAALKFSFPGYGDLFAIHQQYYTWFRAMCAMYGLDSTKHHIWFRPCTAVWFGPHINYGRGHNLSCMAAGQNPPPLVHMQIL